MLALVCLLAWGGLAFALDDAYVGPGERFFEALAVVMFFGIFVFAGMAAIEADWVEGGRDVGLVWKVVLGALLAGGIAVGLFMFGLQIAWFALVVFGLPWTAFTKGRRIWRVYKSSERDFDPDGYRVRRDAHGYE